MKKVLTVIFIILGLLLALGAGIFVGSKYFVKDNVKKEESSQTEEIIEEQEIERDEVLEMSLEQISNILNDNFAPALLHINYQSGENVLSNADNRMVMIDYLLADTAKSIAEINSAVQDHPYIEYETYKTKYEELYGRNYDFASDLNNCSSLVANNNDQLVGTEYISWNATRAPLLRNLTLKADSINKNEEFYTVIGSYDAFTIDEKSKTGTFEISFVNEDNQFAYKAVVLN